MSGGSVTDATGYIGTGALSVGTVTVTGGTFATRDNLSVGYAGNGTLTMTSGSVSSGDTYFGFLADSVYRGTVEGGTWASSGILRVGHRGVGTLTINGGVLTNTDAILGNSASSIGDVTVSNGIWDSSGNVTVGADGTGMLTMSGGLVTVGGTLSQGTYGTIKLYEGGTLQIGVGGTTGVLGVATLTNYGILIFNRSDASTFSGVISGPGAVTKQGTGTLALTGSNNNSGVTTVSAGELKVNGSTGTGAMTIASAATLSGTGTIGGATTISGTHMPGNSPGIQTFASDLTYAQVGPTGPQVYWELAGNTSSNSPLAYDQINVGGNLDFGAGSGLTLAFGSAGSTVTWSNPFWSHWQQWTFYSVSGTTTNSANFLLSATDWLDGSGRALNATRSGYTFYVSQVGNNIVINYVPEPSTYSLAVIGLGVAGLRHLKKRRVASAGSLRGCRHRVAH